MDRVYNTYTLDINGLWKWKEKYFLLFVYTLQRKMRWRSVGGKCWWGQIMPGRIGGTGGGCRWRVVGDMGCIGWLKMNGENIWLSWLERDMTTLSQRCALGWYYHCHYNFPLNSCYFIMNQLLIAYCRDFIWLCCHGSIKITSKLYSPKLHASFTVFLFQLFHRYRMKKVKGI